MNSTLHPLLKAHCRARFTLRCACCRVPSARRSVWPYLQARAADTIADTGIVPVEQRLKALQHLRECILGTHHQPPDFGELARRQGSPAERMLLERAGEALGALGQFHETDRQHIRDVLQTITSGQELDLRRFAGGSEKNILALATGNELDDYTYRVAGLRGEFWTKMCRAHVFPGARLDDQWLLAEGVRSSAKSLQLVNILRDLPGDLRQGRCYLPADELRAAGLTPGGVIAGGRTRRNCARFTRTRHLAAAEAHLADGWAIRTRCRGVPRASAPGLRVAGADRHADAGLAARSQSRLDARQRVKISRSEVKRLMARSVLLYPFPVAWREIVS